MSRYIFKDEYQEQELLEAPLFSYVDLLYKAKIITSDERFGYRSLLIDSVLEIKTKVTREDVAAHLKRQLVDTVTEDELYSFVDSPTFNYNNVCELVRIGRVHENVAVAQKKIRETFLEVLHDII